MRPRRTIRRLLAFAGIAAVTAGGIAGSAATFVGHSQGTGTFATKADWVAPVISITAPTAGASTGPTTPITGIAGTLAGDVPSVTVVIHAGPSATGAAVQTLTGASNPTTGAWSLTPSPALTVGTYTAVARQSDAAGNTGTSTPVTFTVDPTPPVVTITTPAAGSTVGGSTAITGTAGNATGDSSTVQVRVWSGTGTGGTLVRTLTATRSGTTWSVGISPALGSGTYTAQASQQDDVGNTGTSAARTFVVDATAPAVTVTVPANNAWLATGTPTISGAAGNAASDSTTVTLRVYAGASTAGTLVQSQTATRTGTTWTLGTSPALPDGQYTVRAEQSDAVGNLGLSNLRTFRVDTTAPVVTITSPTSGQRRSGAPTFTGTAGIATGDSATVAVSVFAGSTATGTAVRTLSATRNATTGAWSVGTTGLTTGTYTVRATQADSATHTGTATVTFEVDGAAPAPAISAPAAAAVVGGTPAISGTAGNATGDNATVTVRIYNGTTATGGVVRTLNATRSGTTWSITTTPALGSGIYTATATQADDVGNSGVSAPRTFTVDATAPGGVTITQPTSGQRLGTATPTLQGGAGNVAGDDTTLTVRIYAGATATGTVLRTLTATRTGTTWSAGVTPALADGQYTATATQGDAVGNTTTSAARSFFVDTTAPAVSITAPTSGQRRSGAPTFSGTAGIATGDSATVTVSVYTGPTATGTAVRTLTATRNGTTGAWSVGTTGLTTGEYTARAVQLDASANSGSDTVTFLVDTTAPAPAINVPSAGATVGRTPTLSGDAGNATGDSATVTVRIYSGTTATGGVVRTVTATRSGTAWTGAVATAMGSGTYTATATQTDDLGNSGVSAPRTFTVDATAPAGVTIAQPTSGQRMGSSTPTLQGAAGNVTGDDATLTIRLYAGATATGTVLRTLTATRTGATWSVPVSPALADGQYTATATQGDAVGNSTTTGARTFFVDTTAPAVAITAPTASRMTTTPAIAGTGGLATGDLAQMTIRVYAGSTATGTVLQTRTVNRNGTTGAWSVTLTALGDGTYTARASQLDSSANTGSADVTFTIDTAAPAPTVTTPAAGATTGPAPTLAGAAGNATGDAATLTVSVYAGPAASGTAFRTLTATRTGATWTTDVTPALATGTYTAQARQVDDLGHTGTSAARTFIVDADPPSGVAITQPTAGQLVGSGTPTLQGTAGNAAGDDATLTVRIHAGPTSTGPSIRTLTATRTGTTWSVATTPALADGQYTATAEQSDTYGNSTTSATRTFTVDTTPPSVAVTAPPTRVGSTPAIAGTGGLAADDLAAITVRLYAGATATGPVLQTLSTIRNATTGAWTVTPAALADGQYTAQASQADGAGNTGTASRTFTVDTAAPAPTITVPAAAATTGPAPALSGTAGNATGDDTTVTVRVYAGATATGSPVRALTATRSGTAWSVTTSPALTTGTYTATATQTDDVGNSGVSAARTFTVDATGPAGVAITQPTAGQTVGGGTPTLQGTAGTATGDATSLTVRIYTGATATGSPVRTLTATRTAGTWSVASTAPALADGQYTATAEQADTYGNTTTSASRTFSIDATAPALVVTAPTSGQRINTTPAISGTGGIAAGDLATINVNVYSGTTATGTAVRTLTATRNATTGAWTVTPATLAAGTYTLRATQADSLGNTATSDVTFVIDTTRPSAQTIATTNGAGKLAGHLDATDGVSFTFTEAMRPSSFLAGWTGSATPVNVRFFTNGNNDTFSVLNAASTAIIPVAGGSTTTGGVNTRRNFVSGTVTFAATMTLSPDGRTVSIVLGTPNTTTPINATQVGTRNMRWTTSTAALDVAGNAVNSATVSETDNDRDF